MSSSPIALMQKLAAQNVKHAEVYVSVGVIHWRGQELDPIFEGLERGRERGQKDFGVSLLWIFDAVRHFGAEAAQRVFEKAVKYRDRNVVGVGIGGDEVRGPAEWFEREYAYAKDHGLHLTVHAGESAGPESIAAAVNLLHAERIGHGLTAIQDPQLVELLAETTSRGRNLPEQQSANRVLCTDRRSSAEALFRCRRLGYVEHRRSGNVWDNAEPRISDCAGGVRIQRRSARAVGEEFVCGVVPAGGTARQLCAAFPGLIGLSIPYPDLTVWAYE